MASERKSHAPRPWSLLVAASVALEDIETAIRREANEAVLAVRDVLSEEKRPTDADVMADELARLAEEDAALMARPVTFSSQDGVITVSPVLPEPGDAVPHSPPIGRELARRIGRGRR